jgi:hypothetical protein
MDQRNLFGFPGFQIRQDLELSSKRGPSFPPRKLPYSDSDGDSIDDSKVWVELKFEFNQP